MSQSSSQEIPYREKAIEMFEYFRTASSGVKISTQDKVKEIYDQIDCFFLYIIFEPIEVDLFIMNYLKYMHSLFPEYTHVIRRFSNMAINLVNHSDWTIEKIIYYE